MTGRRLLLMVLAVVLSSGSTRLGAHERSESFSHWRYAHGALSGIITVRLREATRLAFPQESDGSLTGILAAHVAQSVVAETDGKPCAAVQPPRTLEAQPGYVRIGVDMQCAEGESLHISVGMFFEVAPTHHHFIYVESESGAAKEAILSVAERTLQLDLKPSPVSGAGLLQFIGMGIEHIATGVDHLAFLLALLATARTFRQVLLAVTGFTLGHSLTLTLAVTGLVQANRGAVESLIGLTIALAAARNLIEGDQEGRGSALIAAIIICSMMLIPPQERPAMPVGLLAAVALTAASVLWLGGTAPTGGKTGTRFIMATGFGLIHGLGFASALQDLHLPKAMLVSTLAGFNIGVEIGQLAAVAMAAALYQSARRVWPAALWRETPAVALNAALLALGTSWFLVRAITR